MKNTPPARRHSSFVIRHSSFLFPRTSNLRFSRPQVMTRISPRLPLQVILVVVLGGPERRRGDDLGDDGTRPLRLRALLRFRGGVALFFVVVEDRRAVL